MVLEGLTTADSLEYRGVEPIDGRDAHAVEAVPDHDEGLQVSINLTVGDEKYILPVGDLSQAERSAAELRRTIWVDDRRRYPIGERNTVEIDGEAYHDLTVHFEELAINEGVRDARFRFDPPASATVAERGTEPTATTEHRKRARELVPYPLPEACFVTGCGSIEAVRMSWGLTTVHRRKALVLTAGIAALFAISALLGTGGTGGRPVILSMTVGGTTVTVRSIGLSTSGPFRLVADIVLSARYYGVFVHQDVHGLFAS